ncbi:MAG: hypothetical protein ACP5H9_00890 [Candidatus Woesearchaeota archaeon]
MNNIKKNNIKNNINDIKYINKISLKKIFCIIFLILFLIKPSFAALEKNVNFFSAWSWSNVDIKIFGNHVLTDKYGNVLKDNSIALNNVKDDHYEWDYEDNNSFDGEWYFNGGSISSPKLIVNNELFHLFEDFMNGYTSKLPKETSIRYVCCKWFELESYEQRCTFINPNDECNEEPGKMLYLLQVENESKKEKCYSFCYSKYNTTQNSSLVESYVDCLDKCFLENKIFRSEEDFFSDLFEISFYNITRPNSKEKQYGYNILCKLENGLWCSAIHFRKYSSGLSFSKPVLIFGDEELKKEFGVGSEALIYHSNELKSVVIENPGFNFVNITNLEEFSEKKLPGYNFKSEEDALKKLVNLDLIGTEKYFNNLRVFLELKLKNSGEIPIEIKQVLFFYDKKNYTFNSLEKNLILNPDETGNLIFYNDDFCSVFGKELNALIVYAPYNYLGSREFVFEKTAKVKFEKNVFYDYFDVDVFYPTDDFFVYEANPSITNNDRIDLHVGNSGGVLRSVIKLKPIEDNFVSAKLRFNVLNFSKISQIRFYPISADFNSKYANFVLMPKTYNIPYDVFIDRNGEYLLDITDILKDKEKIVYGFFVKAYNEGLNNDVIINALESENKPRVILLKRSNKRNNLAEKLC